jgi:hypothetical protein
LPKELALAGITEIEAANRFIRQVYLPRHNARFARPAACPETAFVTADPALLAETLCIEVERIVARDNTVVFGNRRLQLPQSPARAHYVKAKVKVREYPDGTLAVFHGPRRIARYTEKGAQIMERPTDTSLTPGSPPSRRGLARPEPVATPAQRPALTRARLLRPWWSRCRWSRLRSACRIRTRWVRTETPQERPAGQGVSAT